MTRKDAGAFASKRPKSEKPDPRIAEALTTKVTGGELPCHQAEQIAASLQVDLGNVGAALDLMGIRITRCQLGLFGYTPESRIVKPAASVPPNMDDAIRQALVHDRLPCAAAWAISKTVGVPRLKVAEACEALKIKIKPCQLGAF